MWGHEQRHVAEAITGALEPSPQADNVDRICRLLLAADRYAVTHLRAYCLHCLALMFERLSSASAPPHLREVFEVTAAPPLRACLMVQGNPRSYLFLLHRTVLAPSAPFRERPRCACALECSAHLLQLRVWDPA